MTPEQKLKHIVLLKQASFGEFKLPEIINADNVDEIYAEEDEDCDLQDARSETRGGEVETNIPAPTSRHYESKSVAAQYVDGSWVGWTYWYGGGKHGEPEGIGWMGGACNLDCTEEEVTVTKRTFTIPS